MLVWRTESGKRRGARGENPSRDLDEKGVGIERGSTHMWSLSLGGKEWGRETIRLEG